MSDESLPPLPEDIRGLLSREKVDAPAPAEAKARVRERLRAELLRPDAPAPESPQLPRGAGKLGWLGPFIVGTVVGGTAVSLLRPSEAPVRTPASPIGTATVAPSASAWAMPSPSEGARATAEGTTAEGTTAEGATAEGTTAEGTTAEGATAEGRTNSSPSTGSPSTGSPATGSPATGSPATASPSTGSPATGSPATGSPATGSPATASPAPGSAAPGSPAPGSPAPGSPAPGSPASTRAPGPTPKVPPEAGDPRERALLEQARVALARGQPKQALVALEAHAKGYPASRLREEREALTVLALHAAGDASATARAAEFMRRYPQSLFGPAIEAQVRRSSDPR